MLTSLAFSLRSSCSDPAAAASTNSKPPPTERAHVMSHLLHVFYLGTASSGSMVVWLLRRLRSWVRGMRPPFIKNHGVETTRYFMLEGIEEPVVCDVELRSRDAASPSWRWTRVRSEELKLFQKNTVSELEGGREYVLEIRYCSASLVPNPRSLRFTIPSSQEGLAAVKEPLGIIRLEPPRTALTGAFDAFVVPHHAVLVSGVAVVVGMIFAARRPARRTGTPIKSAEAKVGGVTSQHVQDGDEREIATIAGGSTVDNAMLKGQALMEVLGSSPPPCAAARIMSPMTTSTPTLKKARQHVTPLTPPSTQSQRQHQHQDENVTPCAKFPENESDWRRLFDSVYENNASGSCDFLDDYWGTSSSSGVALTGNNNNGPLASPGGQPKARPMLQPYDDDDDCSSDEELGTVMEGTIIKQAQ